MRKQNREKRVVDQIRAKAAKFTQKAMIWEHITVSLNNGVEDRLYIRRT